MGAATMRTGQPSSVFFTVLAMSFPWCTPVLIDFLNDKNADARRYAATALKRIDPEAAKKAGVK
jgi:hypothetical protein